jgi:hypothetical protein
MIGWESAYRERALSNGSCCCEHERHGPTLEYSKANMSGSRQST